MRLKLLLILFIAQLSFATAVVAQAYDPLVLNVTVTNKNGIVIRGLTLDNFSVSVEKTPQKILSLSDQEVPASIGILIDTSASQPNGKIRAGLGIQRQFMQDLEGFLKKSNPANEYFALAFNSQLELVQDWTSDYQSILQRVESLTFGRQTKLYDALRLAIEKMRTSRNSKQVLILISDGVDSLSTATYKEVRDLLRSSDVVLYGVALQNAVGFNAVPDVLNLEIEELFKDLTSVSGGRALFINNSQGSKSFNEVFESIALELRSQYRLVIAKPTSHAGKGWRKLKITASRTNATGRAEELIARTRQGY